MRLRIPVILSLVATLVLAGAASARAAETPARSARAFVDSVGVNIHSYYVDTAYARLDRVLEALRQIHVRHVRDGLLPASVNEGVRSWQRFYFAHLAAQGIGANLVLGSPADGESSLAWRVQQLATLPQGFVESVEGPNEYDLRGGAGWAPRLREWQRRLYLEVRARPELEQMPVLAPSFGQIEHAPAAGDLSQSSDLANIHPYPGGLQSSSEGLARSLAIAGRVSGPGGVVATESGYHNALDTPHDHPPASERAAGAYVPQLLLEYFERGIARTYLYELVDEKPDALGLDREQHFGLFREDFSPKPAAVGLGRLLSLLDRPVGPSEPEPGGLDYWLRGGGGGVEQLLLDRGNGSFALVLWQGASVWDRDARLDLYPPDLRLRLRLASPARIRTKRLLADGTRGARRGTRASVVLPAADTVVVLIKPSR